MKHLPASTLMNEPLPDLPVPRREIEPLVRQLWDGYRCADLLLRLPGAIPIPSFAQLPALPSPDWVDIQTRRFRRSIYDHLVELPSQYTLLPQIPFPSSYPPKAVTRTVVSSPLLVRSPDPKVYTEAGRKRLLDFIGIPSNKQDDSETKILIVSFGGQIFHKPPSHSRTHSRTHSRSSSHPSTPEHPVLGPSKLANVTHPPPTKDISNAKRNTSSEEKPGIGAEALASALHSSLQTPRRNNSLRIRPSRSGGESLLLIPGAPAASVPSSPMTTTIPSFPTIVPPTPKLEDSSEDIFAHSIEEEYQDDVFGTLLPDESWIAVVCGVPKDWAMEDGEALPENFFVAPKDVYMPDLTAVADVLLGKLVRRRLSSLYLSTLAK